MPNMIRLGEPIAEGDTMTITEMPLADLRALLEVALVQVNVCDEDELDGYDLTMEDAERLTKVARDALRDLPRDDA